MSVKNMTTEQIRADLSAVARTWPDGVPEAQNDRVNALKGELKRRGAEVTVAAKTNGTSANTAMAVVDMTDEQLEKALRQLSEEISKDPKDEALQDRFANVRYEMRKRAKAADEPPTRSPLPPRAMEIPDAPPTMTPADLVNAANPPTNIVNGWQVGTVGRDVLLTASPSEGNVVMTVASLFKVEDAEKFVFAMQSAIARAKNAT